MFSDRMISVVVPIYNTAQYLPDCIDSIIGQTYQNIEIILVDDGSTDGSGEICEKYSKVDSRIRVLHQKNMGVAAARNAGIACAAGTYIAFVDADDWIERDAFNSMLHQMESADLVTAGYWKDYADSSERIMEKIPMGSYHSKEQLKYFYKNMLYFNNEIFDDTLASIWNKIFLLKLVKKFYHELDVSLRYYEDAIFVYSYLLQCKSIVISDGAYYHYRIREDSAVNSEYHLFLRDVNYVYLYLNHLFSNHSANHILQHQLQRWIIELSLHGINEKMGFSEDLKIPTYLIPFQLNGKKIVLYGAGKIGREYRRSLMLSNANIVLWVDRSYANLQQLGFPVESPANIRTCEFDYVLIAVKEVEMAQSIRKGLELLGISTEKILWKQPVSLLGLKIGG